MTEEPPTLTHHFATPVDLLASFEYLGIDAPTVDETRAFVVYRSAVLELNVTEGELSNAAAIAVEVWDFGELPSETEPSDLLTDFVTEIEDMSQ